MNRSCPEKRAKKSVKGWALIHPDDKPLDGGRWWWSFDVYRTRGEALRVKSLGEKVVRVVVKRG